MPFAKWWVAAVLATAALLASLAPLLTKDEYDGLTGAIQALGVVAALALATETLRAQTRDARVDRALAFQSELVTGELQEARVRLVGHIRTLTSSHAGSRASQALLQDDPIWGRYDADTVQASPRSDLNLLLRYFERAHAAQKAGSVDIPIFHALVARQACWWDKALARNKDETSLILALRDLADWGNEYARRNQHRGGYLSTWGSKRGQDFPDRIGVAAREEQ